MGEIQIAIGIVVIVASVAIFFSLRDRYNDLSRKNGDYWPEGEHNPWVEWRGEKLDEGLIASFGKEELACIDRSFLTRLVGVKYPNDDGSSRTGFIRRLWPKERLVVRWEKGYPKGEGLGKSISRQNGQQIGWLGRDVAKEIHSDFIEPGHTWMAVFQYPTSHPETGETVGAVILVVRRTPVAGEWFWDRSKNTHLFLDCPTCGAKSNSYCKTKNGSGTYTAHAARIRAFQEIMRQRSKPQ